MGSGEETDNGHEGVIGISTLFFFSLGTGVLLERKLGTHKGLSLFRDMTVQEGRPTKYGPEDGLWTVFL